MLVFLLFSKEKEIVFGQQIYFVVLVKATLVLWLWNLCQTTRWKIYAIEILKLWGIWAGYSLSIAEFKNLRFIHREGWQQNNPQNISFLAKYVPGEIKKKKVMWMLLMSLAFCQISSTSRILEQMLFLFSGF